MGVAELKEELHDYIDHADERFLKMVYAMSIIPYPTRYFP